MESSGETWVVLMSGGLDSTTVAAVARERGAVVIPLLVDYGQRHRVELERAEELARTLGCREPVRVSLDLRAIGGSALTDDAIPVPKDRDVHSIGGLGKKIPSTYVPCRNMIFLSLAFALAEKVGADAVAIGVNAVDYSGYPDCRPAFTQGFEDVAPYASARFVETGKRVRLETPLIGEFKSSIVDMARRLGVPVERTWSCYDPHQGEEPTPCGRCDSCVIRVRAGA